MLPTIRRIELIGKKEFAVAAFDPEHEIYVVHIASLSFIPLVALFNVHPFQRPQISSLITKKAPTKVFAEYLDFADVFFPDLAFKLPKHSKINNHTIELVDGC